MTDIAHELSRRASPRYIGEQAKETALNKTSEWKDQIISSPMALGLIGGVLGAAIGRSLARSRQTSVSERRFFSEDRPFRDLHYEGERAGAGSVRDRIAEGADELKGRASDLAADVRDRIPSAAELGRKAEDNPMMIALGGIALGAMAALLLPVTQKERELLDPVKQRAGEAVGTLREKIDDRVQQTREKLAGTPEESSSTDKFPPLPENPLVTH